MHDKPTRIDFKDLQFCTSSPDRLVLSKGKVQADAKVFVMLVEASMWLARGRWPTMTGEVHRWRDLAEPSGGQLVLLFKQDWAFLLNYYLEAQRA